MNRLTVAALGALLGLAAIQRFTYHREYRQKSVVARVLLSDARAYHRLACNLASEDTEPDPSIVYHTAGYPLWVGAIYRLTGTRPETVYLIQSLFGLGLIFLTLLLGWQLGGFRIGMLAATLTALYGPLLFYETKLMPTVSATLLNMGLLWMLTRRYPTVGGDLHHAPVTTRVLPVKQSAPPDKPRSKQMVGVGLLLGLAVVWRPNMILMALVVCAVEIYRWWKNTSDQRWQIIRPAGLFRLHRNPLFCALLAFTVFAGLLSLAAYRNYQVSGVFNPFPANGGTTFYGGNNPAADGRYTPYGALSGDKAQQAVEAARLAARLKKHSHAGLPGPYATSSTLTRHTLGWLVTHPWRALELGGLKLYRFAMSHEPRSSYAYEAEKQSLVSLAMAPLPWAVLWVFGLLGFWVTRKSARFFYLRAYAIIHLAVALIFFVAGRYRAPLAPVAAIFAAFGIQEIVLEIGRKKWIYAALPLSLAAVVGLSANPLDNPRSARAVDAFNEGVALLRLERPSEALHKFRKASRLRPKNPIYRLHVGNALAALHQHAKAAKTYKRILTAHPHHVEAHINLGVMACHRQALTACRRYLRKAVALAPHNPLAHLRLGQALLLSQHPKQARHHLKKAQTLARGVQTSVARQAAVLLSEQRPTRTPR
jgi:tetratricopeptide (TPR) repeat protein